MSELPLVEINLKYLKRNKKFRKLNQNEENRFDNKVLYFQKMENSDFIYKSQLKRWRGKLPGEPPRDLDIGIINNGLFQFRINKKFRVYAFIKDNTYFIVWRDPDHKNVS